MANRLGKIFGTEEDKVNCPFYFKIGACRHGDKCVRTHTKPIISQTLLFRHMYQNPPIAIAIAEGNKVSDEALKESLTHFEDFFEEVFLELAKNGEIKDIIVCDNLGDHLIGNVYVKFGSEEEAESAIKNLSGRYYSGKQIVGEYSPVTDFRESRCRQFEEGACGRGGYCNFMHLKYISRDFKKSLFEQMYDEHPQYLKKRRSVSREKVKSKRRKNSSSESDLADRNSEERRRIIEKWNRRYDKEREEEKRKREAAEAKMNFILLQQKLQENLNKLKEDKEKEKDDKTF